MTGEMSPSEMIETDDEQDRLTDLRHVECLHDMQRRLWGLRVAIEGLMDTSGNEHHTTGVLQLADDIVTAMEKCVDEFEAERLRRMTPEQRDFLLERVRQH